MQAFRPATLFPWLEMGEKSTFDLVSRYSNQAFIRDLAPEHQGRDLLFVGKKMFSVD
jgi:hypothetical protein